LELVSEIHKAQNALGLMPMQDLERLESHQAFSGMIAATSKVALLGDMRTVQVARRLLTLINETYFKAVA
jgi:hypothetical protein